MLQAPLTSKISPLAEKPSLEAVKTAIRTVLSADPSVDRKAASEWLDALKSSIFSWEICDQLLLNNEGIEVGYLAAHMLRQKISRNFNELPIEAYPSLKDSMLNHLQKYEDYAIQGQLTMAIADLTLLLPSWACPIEDLAKQLNLQQNFNYPDHLATYQALHKKLLFAYIIHQMCDLNHHSSERPCRIGAKRREEYEDYLISKCSQTITWWLSTLNEVNELKNLVQSDQPTSVQSLDQQELRVKILDTIDKLIGQIYLCYSAWLRIFDEDNVNESLPLIDHAFKHLSDVTCSDMVHKYAVEVVVATSNYCEDNSKVSYLVNHLVNQIYTLAPAFRQSVSNEDLEKSTNFARTFTTVAETACLTFVIENRDFKLIELLLSCLNHYDFEVVEETYAFWWALLEHVQNRLKESEYGPLIGYIHTFVMCITKLCQFDPDEDNVVPQENDIHAFRANSAEIITNVMFVTTVENFLRDNSILNEFRLDLTQVPWEKNEAILFLISCLVQMLTRDENHIRMQIFNCILTQQTHHQDIQPLIASRHVPIKIGTATGEVHPQTAATSLRIIGSLDNLLADNPDHLALAINYILTCMSHSTYGTQLTKFGATALCNILELNADRHFSSCPELLLIVKNLCNNLDQFDEHASSELLRCAAYMAEAIKDPSVKDQFLCEIFTPILNSLKTVLNAPNKQDEMEPTKYLDRFSVVFKQLSEANIPSSVVPELKNFITLIDNEMWPVIVKVLELYASQRGHAIERSCRTIRYLIRCIKPEWMISKVAETMVNLYKSYPQNSSPVYICSILVDEFSNKNPEINQILFAMLEIFCTLTFTLLELNNSQSQSLLNMKTYPETVDDMMRLFNRFMKKCPKDFVNCKALESIIELSIYSLRIDHSDANKNVSRFIISFIQMGQNQDYPNIAKAIRDVLGARFTDAVINACLFHLPTSLIGEEAQILMELYNFDKYLFHKWVEAAVSSLPQGTESVTTSQLDDFKKEITTAGTTKLMVNCLRAFARLYY